MSDWSYEDDLLLRASQIGERKRGGAAWFAPECGEPPQMEPDWRAITERWIENARFEHTVGRSWYRRYRQMCRATVPLICVITVLLVAALWGWLR